MAKKSHVKKILQDRKNIDLLNNVTSDIDKAIATTIQQLKKEAKEAHEEALKENKGKDKKEQKPVQALEANVSDRSKLIPLKEKIALSTTLYFHQIGLPISLEYDKTTAKYTISALEQFNPQMQTYYVITEQELQYNIKTIMQKHPDSQNELQKHVDKLGFWLKDLDQDINKMVDNELKRSDFRDKFKSGLAVVVNALVTLVVVAIGFIPVVGPMISASVSSVIGLIEDPIKDFCKSENKIINAFANGIYNKFCASEESKQNIMNTKDNMSYLISFADGLQAISNSINKQQGAAMQMA